MNRGEKNPQVLYFLNSLLFILRIEKNRWVETSKVKFYAIPINRAGKHGRTRKKIIIRVKVARAAHRTNRTDVFSKSELKTHYKRDKPLS